VKLGRISTGGWLGFAISVDAQRWMPLPVLGVDPADTGTAIAVCQLWQSWGAELPPGSVAAEALHCPITVNQRVVGVGANFADHAAEVGMSTSAIPFLYERSPHTLAAPDDAVLVSASPDQCCDYEVELAAVIGCRPSTATTAPAPIFGYAVANDLTLRALQRVDPAVTRAKSALRSCPVGPYITTVDEISELGALEMVSRVNGAVRQRDRLRAMIHSATELVADIELAATLRAGDVILTGSPAGTAAGHGSPQYLLDGDVVECSIEQLGSIRNTVRLRGNVA
jgi:2-keto-4-pentenoate hydratase/2-oxohepta-3-ene-1,7-dioic acid hydratase in catechol pathway